MYNAGKGYREEDPRAIFLSFLHKAIYFGLSAPDNRQQKTEFSLGWNPRGLADDRDLTLA